MVKIAPDLEWAAIEEILALIEEHRLAGIIATNTTIDHSSIAEEQRTTGGLSGAPLTARSTEVVRFIAERSKAPIIAVGGILTADDALQKFDAGAALVQLYTGYIYEGPGLIGKINRALLRRG
jgi:dihydroorotate dehydrogenase